MRHLFAFAVLLSAVSLIGCDPNSNGGAGGNTTGPADTQPAPDVDQDAQAESVQDN